MVFNPYFRYRTMSLDMKGIHAPIFPEPIGEQQHTYLTEKNKYGVTTRRHGTTSLDLQTRNIQKTIRDTIWAFWNTTLSKGYNDMTVIDHRGRMLFDVSWGEWREQWRKERGGLYNINYDLQSPMTWTPPCWGCFPTTTKSLVNHNLSGDDLTLDDGQLEDSSDVNVLRQNGFALKLTGTGGGDIGAYASVGPWKSSYQYNSLTLFCQFRAGQVADMLYLMLLAGNSFDNYFGIKLENIDASNNALVGIIANNSNTSEITKAAGTYQSVAVDTWYDVAISFEAVTNTVKLYYATSGTSTSFTNFLYGASDIENGIASTLSAAHYPPDYAWSTLSLLRESDVGGVTGNNFYLQNAMVFDGFISAQEFNTLRRLCNIWNNKTSGTWPA